ncbi:AGAP012680-PA [Anopheles gambiae str. PEST]|uniref:AGAP012680-PA n=3 Tax=gambiae species complex TaxID=44542 RepID=Q7QLE6_ANOGA|nr:AGAP012680-PA [Anopheles gambiae str. PEST]
MSNIVKLALLTLIALIGLAVGQLSEGSVPKPTFPDYVIYVEACETYGAGKCGHPTSDEPTEPMPQSSQQIETNVQSVLQNF